MSHVLDTNVVSAIMKGEPLVLERLRAVQASLERRGVRIEDFDAAIAAHASARAATLVTANVTHMARVVGLRVEDWSKP